MTDIKLPAINTEQLFKNPNHTISIYGSCVSRDLFGANVKDMCFVANQSLISTFGEPFDVSDNFVLNSSLSKWRKKVILQDLQSDSKLNNLLDADTLIVDLVGESYGIYYKDGSVATATPYFRMIGGVELAEHMGYQKISQSNRRHWEMWCKAADAFLTAISGRFQNRILNCAGSVMFYNDFSKRGIAKTLMANQLLKRKYDYLDRHGDFIRVTHGFSTLVGDVNNHWGKGPRHYRMPYYTRLRDKIAAIINQD